MHATRLWRAGVALFGSHPEVFEPRAAADLPFSTLKRLLAGPGVSQRQEKDTEAWLRIARSLAAGDGPRVYKVIHRGIGDADELLKEAKSEDRVGPRFPMLRGPKIGPMWVRMQAEPGGATITGLDTLSVAVDVHVCRATANLGVVPDRLQDLRDVIARVKSIDRPLRYAIESAWQEAVAGASICGPSRIAGTCAALDPALWSFGKYGCSHCEKVGTRVPIGRACDHCQLPT